MMFFLFTLLLACSQSDRLVVIGMDGLDPQVMQTMLDAGELPHFAQAQTDGISADLQVSHFPIYSPPIWTSIASGYPDRVHGIGSWTRSGEVYRSTDVAVDRLWNVADQAGKTSMIIGWLMTTPVESIKGAMISDEAVFQMAREKNKEINSERRIEHLHPLEKWGDTPSLVPEDDWYPKHPLLGYQYAGLPAHRHPLRIDEVYLRAWEQMYPQMQPDLGMIYFRGADQLAHLIEPSSESYSRKKDADIDMDVIRSADGNWVLDYYRYLDTVLGRLVATLDMDRTTVVLCSDHGYNLVADPSSGSPHRSPGVLYAWGKRVSKRGRVSAMTQRDLAPTLFALAGLPRAEDMEGEIITDPFDIPTSPPLDATHKRDTPKTENQGANEGQDDSHLEQLKALGYVDDQGNSIP